MKKILEVLKEVEPVGAVGARIVAALFDGDRLVAIGHNRYKTHPVMAHFSSPERCFLHAEIDCLIRAYKPVRLEPTRYYKNPSMLILRKGHNGFINCRPCPICQKALKHFGVEEVHYTNQEGKIVRYEHTQHQSPSLYR